MSFADAINMKESRGREASPEERDASPDTDSCSFTFAVLACKLDDRSCRKTACCCCKTACCCSSVVCCLESDNCSRLLFLVRLASKV